jgi:hypothetical protein
MVYSPLSQLPLEIYKQQQSKACKIPSYVQVNYTPVTATVIAGG